MLSHWKQFLAAAGATVALKSRAVGLINKIKVLSPV
jgi:hypothetical protein